jgi:hypothetical protein
MSTVTSAGTPATAAIRWRTIGRVLTWAAAIAAISAAVSAVSDVTAADNAALIVQSWRMYGLLLCGGLFVLLALRPRVHGAIWALVIGHKAALAITAATFVAHGGIPEAAETLGWDSALAVVLITAYVMSRAKSTGPSPRSVPPVPH